MSEQAHPCITPGCDHTVEFDDEPWCFTHSPDSGSAVRGYSYAASPRAAVEKLMAERAKTIEEIKDFDPFGARGLAMLNKCDQMAINAGEYA